MEGVDGEPAATRVAPAAPADHTPEVHFLDGGLEVRDRFRLRCRDI